MKLWQWFLCVVPGLILLAMIAILDYFISDQVLFETAGIAVTAVMFQIDRSWMKFLIDEGYV